MIKAALNFISIFMRPWLSWIERRTTNPDVAGSNPAGRTKQIKGLAIRGWLLVFVCDQLSENSVNLISRSFKFLEIISRGRLALSPNKQMTLKSCDVVNYDLKDVPYKIRPLTIKGLAPVPKYCPSFLNPYFTDRVRRYSL
jgi:hypothetical protein